MYNTLHFNFILYNIVLMRFILVLFCVILVGCAESTTNLTFEELYALAESGQSEAQYSLGLCYFFGDGIDEDKTEAVNWFKKSATNGNIQAQFSLGMSYLRGVGVDKDETTGLFWLLKSAEGGEPNAIALLNSLE